MWTQAECAKCLTIKRWHTNGFIIQRRCCLHYVLITTDVKEWNTITAVTWWTAHGDIVAEAFLSKKSSSVPLIDEQQASQKRCLLICHPTTSVNKSERYIWTKAECAKRLIIERWHTRVFIFQQRYCLHWILITTAVKQSNTISAVTCRTVLWNIIADAFRSKKSLSALLVHDKEASQMSCLHKCHSTAFG